MDTVWKNARHPRHSPIGAICEECGYAMERHGSAGEGIAHCPTSSRHPQRESCGKRQTPAPTATCQYCARLRPEDHENCPGCGGTGFKVDTAIETCMRVKAILGCQAISMTGWMKVLDGDVFLKRGI